jgi:hypothetical protein
MKAPAAKPELVQIAIAVIMWAAAVATDFFWLAKAIGRPFPQTIPVSRKVYDAFAVPDIVMSLLLYVGAYGLVRVRKYGDWASLVGLGMWLFDVLLVLGITGTSKLSSVGPSLVFVVASLTYLVRHGSRLFH